MKKVCVVLLLVSGVLFTGCQGPDNLQSLGEAKPATPASGRAQFWDSNLRPTPTVVSQPRAKQPPLRPAVQEQTVEASQVATAPIEATGAAPAAMQPQVMTASVDRVGPSFSGPLVSTYGQRVPVGRDLVSVDEPAGSSLSITYPRPDYGIIQIDKTLPQEVRLNTPFAYKIQVTNLTEMMLTKITITETISKDFEFKGAEPIARVDRNSLVWEIDSLGPRASKSIKISGTATVARPLEHSTAITHTVEGSGVMKVVEPTLELAKNAPAEALLCEPIEVEFVVTNTGTGAAQNVQIVDTLPAGLQTTDGKGKVTLDAGTLAAGESRRFSIKLRATKTGTYVNKAVATSASGLKAESEPTLTNVRQPVLTLVKAGPKRQYLGRAMSYELTVTNKGDGPAQNTMIEDIIPPGVTAIEATAGAQFSGSKLIWEIGTLAPNASKTVQVSYTPTREGELMATATATAYCAEPVTDSSRTIITGIAASRLEVIDQLDPVEVNTNNTYIITVTNEGTAADTNVRITVVLDDKLQYVTSAGATAGSVMGKTVTFTPLRGLEPKNKATWRVVVRGAVAGDARFKVTMHTDQLALPEEQTIATRIYRQMGNGD
ncbi:MAG TPA: choice-of-anchor D domain-containing protein [Sedimentisphaerales bacterium]|jgi:uncharacterized repeat protein (TIGR01451 family)|nr:choice-of-anchor D domain-containing protein [Sedimentisphaerales bacterium]HNU30010.1 choice-of-anchor D domain-containing protein [Sedimentisphaerales bacterium]